MRLILWRIFLAFGMSAVGLAVGAWSGARFFVSKADGMVGGVMVLWYGLLGAIIFLLISIFLGSKLKGKALPVTALIFALLASIYYGMAVFKARENFQADAGSDSAYSKAGKFSATMERLDLSDPYLFIKMEVDSGTRKWVQTGPGPEHQVFTASLRAKTLVEMREALENVAAMSTEDLADCQSAEGPAIKRLSWDIRDTQTLQSGRSLVRKGTMDLSALCLREHFVINRALMLVEKASQSPLGKVKRK